MARARPTCGAQPHPPRAVGEQLPGPDRLVGPLGRDAQRVGHRAEVVPPRRGLARDDDRGRATGHGTSLHERPAHRGAHQAVRTGHQDHGRGRGPIVHTASDHTMTPAARHVVAGDSGLRIYRVAARTERASRARLRPFAAAETGQRRARTAVDIASLHAPASIRCLRAGPPRRHAAGAGRMRGHAGPARRHPGGSAKRHRQSRRCDLRESRHQVLPERDHVVVVRVV